MRYLVVLALLATGCAGIRDDGRVRVVAGLYPLAYVVRLVGGARVDVTDLTPPGAEPHEIELAPRTVARIERADVVVLVPGLQPEADAAASAHTTLDAFAGLRRISGDPHLWLDPSRLAALAPVVAARLAQVDPAHDTEYLERGTSVGRDLAAIDTAYRDGLTDCARRDVVTSHQAFGYLADRYHLTQVGIAGLSPEAEPSPARLADAARYVREHHVTTVFFESLVSPKVAETVARETGAATAVLDPVESVKGGDDYPTVMRRNLAALRLALGCR